MKIVDFDKLNGTLHIKFASENSKADIDSYPSHMFNVLEMSDSIDTSEILKALAVAGWNIAVQQEVAEEISSNSKKIDTYAKLVGLSVEYSDEELFSPEPTVASENQPSTAGLMVI